MESIISLSLFADPSNSITATNSVIFALFIVALLINLYMNRG